MLTYGLSLGSYKDEDNGMILVRFAQFWLPISHHRLMFAPKHLLLSCGLKFFYFKITTYCKQSQYSNTFPKRAQYHSHFIMLITEETASASACVCLYQQLRQLEVDLQQQKERNDGLVRQLEDEILRRDISETNLTQHKDALLEKSQQLMERDQTIETQNTLLGFAWAEAQASSSAIRERDQKITLLNNQLEGVISTKQQDSPELNENKKRKISP